MPFAVGLETLNKGDGRKKVRSVVDSKHKVGNSIKVTEERVSKVEPVSNRTIHIIVLLFLFRVCVYETYLAQKHAERAFEASCTIQGARCTK